MTDFVENEVSLLRTEKFFYSGPFTINSSLLSSLKYVVSGQTTVAVRKVYWLLLSHIILHNVSLDLP